MSGGIAIHRDEEDLAAIAASIGRAERHIRLNHMTKKLKMNCSPVKALQNHSLIVL